jgi:putative endonuclease
MGENRMSLGVRGEQWAAEFLVRNGLTILARNYRHERAEVDLVCRDGDELVFVEVKSRRSSRFGDPEEAVTESKQEQLRKAAEGFCQEFLLEDIFYRFDIVAVLDNRGIISIRHIKDAF